MNVSDYLKDVHLLFNVYLEAGIVYWSQTCCLLNLVVLSIISKMTMPIGLTNTDNTCFMNSDLQCLMQCKSFRKCAIEYGSVEATTPVLFNFREFILLYENRALQIEQPAPFSADFFKSFLLATINSKFDLGYQRGQQHDAHEVLGHLFQIISLELEAVGGDPTQLYNFSYSQIATCTSCGLQNSLPVIQFGLTLSVAPQASDIMARLNDYLRNEHIDLNCSEAQCNSRRAIVSKTDIVFPELVIVLFNRYEGLFFQNSPVNVPFQLMLNSSDYVLRGVVNHFGTMELGHYQSVVFLNGKQFKISDELVQQNKNERIDRCYLAFYERRCEDDNMEHALPSLLAPAPESTVSASFQQDKHGKKTQRGKHSGTSRQGTETRTSDVRNAVDSLPVIEQQNTNEDVDKNREKENAAKRSRDYRQRKKAAKSGAENESGSMPVIKPEDKDQTVGKDQAKKAKAAKRNRDYRQRKKDTTVVADKTGVDETEFDFSSAVFLPPRKKIKIEPREKQYILCEAAPRPISTTGNIYFYFCYLC